MGDEVLKIRFEADTATLRQFKDEIKRLNEVMLDAPQKDIPAVRAKIASLKETQDQLRGGTGALMKDYFEFGTALRAAGVQQSGLTTFIKEQRVEMRLQNFLLNQGKGAAQSMAITMAALNGVMGGSGAVTQAVNTSMSATLNTFQGLDFASRGLAASLGLTGTAFGGIALAISVLIAIGVGLIPLLRRSGEEAKKAVAEGLKQYNEMIDRVAKNMRAMSGEQIEANRSLLTEEQNTNIKRIALIDEITKRQKQGLGDVIVLDEDVNKAHLNQVDIVKEATKGITEEQKKAREALGLPVEGVTQLEERMRLLRDRNREIAVELNAVGNTIVASTRDMVEAVKILSEIDKELFPVLSKQSEVMVHQLEVVTALSTVEGKRLLQAEAQAIIARDMVKLPVAGVKVGQIKPTRELGISEMDAAQENLKQYAILVNPLLQGFNRVGDVIQRELIDKVIGARSVFQQFVGGVLAGMAQIAEQVVASAFIAGILSAIIPGAGVFRDIFKGLSGFQYGGLIPEPVVGVGLKSGRGYSIAERGPEWVSPLTHPSARMIPIHITGTFENKLKGRDLGAAVRIDEVFYAKGSL